MPTDCGNAAITSGPTFPLPPHQPDDLPALRQQFPGYDIRQETTGERTRYVARRRDRSLHPHTVITADPDELRATLRQEDPS